MPTLSKILVSKAAEFEKATAAVRAACGDNLRAMQLVTDAMSKSDIIAKAARDRLKNDFPHVARALDAVEGAVAKAMGQPRSHLVEMAKSRRDQLNSQHAGSAPAAGPSSGSSIVQMAKARRDELKGGRAA